MSRYKQLLDEFEGHARLSGPVKSLMEYVSERLHEQMPRYNWVGFYLMENTVPPTLVLGPYVGSFIPIARIRLDQGLCGAAATTRKTVVVNDVSTDPRYIGGDMVKSNMITPILVKNLVVAEIDVESYFTNTFAKADQEFIESCASLVGRCMAR